MNPKCKMEMLEYDVWPVYNLHMLTSPRQEHDPKPHYKSKYHGDLGKDDLTGNAKDLQRKIENVQRHEWEEYVKKAHGDDPYSRVHDAYDLEQPGQCATVVNKASRGSKGESRFDQ